jgi:hypothetical protein
MKYAKFREYSEKYPWLSEVIGFSLQGSILLSGVLKEVIRTKIGFITFRPFETLSMEVTESSEGSIIPDERYKHVKMERWATIRYYIYFHIRGNENPERIAFPSQNSSVGERIEELKKWYLSCEAFKDTTLVFDRVIRLTTTGSSYTGLSNANFEIYEFPLEKAGTRHPLRTPEIVPNQLVIDANRAYMNNQPMPPIMPGQILSTHA